MAHDEQRYRFLRKLGQGGMGEVYLVEHVNLGRNEALKILQPELAGDPRFVQRFRREARATNRVQHPNIVSVYDFGKLADGRFYLAMEYVDGQRLDQVLELAGGLPVPRTLHVLRQLVEALEHAHAHGVIHRDLKPANLILTTHRGQKDTLKVLDFGMAKLVAPEDAQGTVLTAEGEVVGTPQYMAPEQFVRGAIDARTDIYAVGCIAYELLTGRPPFAGRRLELMDGHMTQVPPRPAHLRPSAAIPADLDDIVARCLEKRPPRRFQSAKELREALAAVTTREPRPARAGGGGVITLRGMAPMQRDFEAVETTLRALESAEATLEGAAPIEIAPAHLRDAYRALALDAAERVLDLGYSGADLIFAAVEARELSTDLARVDAQVQDVDQRLALLEQEAREREASLRFALADLEFEAERPVGDSDVTGVDVRGRMDELQQRIERQHQVSEREMKALSDLAIELASTRARLDERLATRVGELVHALQPAFDRYASEGSIGAIAARLADVRERIGLA